MDPVWIRLALAFAAYVAAFFFAFFVLRDGARLKRRIALIVAQLFVLSVPFWMPGEEKLLRFFMALPSLLVFVRLWETAEGKTADPKALDTPRNFVAFFTGVADLRFGSSNEWKAENRRRGAERLGRASFKALCLVALLIGFREGPQVLETPVLAPLWCLLAAYCAATGAADCLTALSMLVSGQRASEVFRSPLLARSPTEFWSQRWNLMFRNSAFRLVFLPLGGRSHPVYCTWAVFAFSAAIHEYIVLAALECSGGHMSAFFALHGCATVLNLWTRKRFRRRVPAPLALLTNWTWMIATAPVFFAPILEVFQLDRLLSW